jgi:hypothetical protein
LNPIGKLRRGISGPEATCHGSNRVRIKRLIPAGEIEAVTEGARGQMMGTHLTVKTPDGAQEVMLGPSQFIASKHFSFAKGDSVEVTGSKVTIRGSEYVIAREVVKDGKTLTLRDKAGTPEWAGKGMSRKGPPQ